jgi:2-succinyl-5-enolpyruvyl-6-hydroxy-3-cyclohexene-1-carboxylate synthase
MTIDTGMLNLRWAELIIDQLIINGVDTFCIAPGSRSTPLAIAIAEHPLAQSFVHFDERGIAFYAVGMGKATRRAVAILVTSGTAVGNLLPGLMEAESERIPLIVLTADRPPELQDCGASQTCDQVKLFSDYVRWQCNLPCPTSEIPERYLATTIAHAVFEAHGFPSGPVHLNCMFRKPLFSHETLLMPDVVPLKIERGERAPTLSSLKVCAEKMEACKHGLIIVGSRPCGQKVQPLLDLAEHLKWPILPDILSQVRTEGDHPSIIRYYETLLRISSDLKPDMVLHFGNRIVSKVLKYWLKELPLTEYIQVANHPDRQDPHHQVTWRFMCCPALFCRGILAEAKENTDTQWLNAWKTKSERIESSLNELFQEREDLTEPGIVRELNKSLPSSCALFVANSMPIRDADLFLYPDQPIGPVFGNRGVAGIDGNIATVAGIAAGIKKPVIALLGDLTTLHDLNSLPLLTACDTPVLIVVVNNQGGGIFSFLPIAEKKDLFEKFVATIHPFNFEHAAKLFHLPYQHIDSKQDWETALISFYSNPQTAMIEISTERTSNYQFHQEITRHALRAQLNYTAKGDPKNPALIFLHGFLGAKEDWEDIVDTLSGDYFCLTLDLPGHAHTPFTADVCAHISAWLSTWDLKTPSLVGYSLGGRIAWQLKTQSPTLYKRVIIFSAHPGLTEETEREIRREKDNAWAELLEKNTLTDFLERWYDQPLFASLKNKPDLYEAMLRRRIHADPYALAQIMRTLSLGAQPKLTESAIQDTLCVYGEEDLKFEQLYATLPSHVAVRKILRTGHAVIVENPKECAHIIKSHMESYYADTTTEL